MTAQPTKDGSQQSEAIEGLYRDLLANWNRHDARGFAGLFLEHGNVIGFDGSSMDGRATIESELSQIFAHHPTRPYLGIVREVRELRDGVVLLRAVAGMYPPGTTNIDPAVNAIQTIVAVLHNGRWRIALYQNTPAAFHGRPELAQQLTAELEQALVQTSLETTRA